MSEVRPLSADDVGAVTALYYRILRHSKAPPPAALSAYFRAFYLDGPYRDPDIPALVHVADNGHVNGFVGIHSVPYLLGERRLRAAFCGALMSEDHESDPLAGARLLKAFVSGPQDISLSETANVISETMWTKLRGRTIPGYSFEWFRVFRPAGFAAALAGEKAALARHLAPITRFIDGKLSGRPSLGRFSPATAPAALTVDDADFASFADAVRKLSADKQARPDWENGYLDHVLANAVIKPAYGQAHMGLVKTKSGEPIGAFLYHLKWDGIGRVLQVMAIPGRLGPVLDLMFAHALEHGAAGLRGRSSPDLIEAATGRYMIMATISSTVIHAKDPALTEPFLSGNCMLTGLAGERWNRFFGGDFE
ncbi:hypothetical protein [Rhizobium sp. C4]|uniref:hypothetical protein n=1 Tax=Rhizobium sp. C4 TaxID=1349800 RepID=UPI001E4FB71D|nr:hypothetical protein [Rhizobium sp. C4]MCD2172510.1 hypothetical protein [Rhizobium sp. C4]